MLVLNAKGGKLREQFRKFDLDKNGSVDYDELRTGAPFRLLQQHFSRHKEPYARLWRSRPTTGCGPVQHIGFHRSIFICHQTRFSFR